MTNVLIKYLQNRYQQTLKDYKPKKSGPAITVSCECGCSGNIFADKLLSKIEAYHKTKNKTSSWRRVSHEIIENAAKELNCSAKDLQYVFKFEQKNAFDEILDAFSEKYYKSDRKIRKTIKQVIRNFAVDGHVIIVGRGGVIISNDIKDSFHIRMVAPLEWRIQNIMKKKNFSFDKAKAYVMDFDRKRQYLKNQFAGKKTDDSIYDIIFNAASLNCDEIVDIVMKIIEKRKLI